MSEVVYCSHHDWEEYVLADESEDSYYAGWRCAFCGAEGYSVYDNKTIIESER